MVRGGVGGVGEGRPCQQIFVKRPLKGPLSGEKTILGPSARGNWAEGAINLKSQSKVARPNSWC